jgi:sulfite exporter TauE/SafE
LLDAVSVAVLGLLLGLRHATDADHVVAVTAIVSRERTLRRAGAIGALWGIGHSLTVLAVGGSIVAFRLVIPPRVGLGLEFAVALMLILLGFANLRHTHAEVIAPSGTWRPLLVGTVHGLAGSAAVALLVLATITETSAALGYLAVFGLGTIVGMMIVTVMLAAPALYAASRVHRLQRGIRLAAGALSVVFGVLLARELVVEGGLFSEQPVWEAR